MTGSLPAVHNPLGPRPVAVRPRTLAALADHLGTALPEGTDPSTELTGITHDSRDVRSADAYAALPGARCHGADFAAAAVAAGARAVVTDPAGAARCAGTGVPVLVVADPRRRLGELAAWIYGEPAIALTLIGVTGTNGKTTTSHLVEAGLRAAGRRTGLVGTVETRIGDERVASVHTTPEAPELHALLAVMREREVDAAVMEVSSHALAFGRVDGIRFDVAAFTNLSRDHLDFHRDLEEYFATKATLFTTERSRVGIVNVDDPYGARLAAAAPIPVVTVSPGGRRDAEWRVTAREVAGPATTFTLTHRDGRSVRPVSPLAGAFNVENAALAAVTCLTVGVDPQAMVRGMAGARVPGRMERVQGGRDDEPLGLVDYAHSPEAVDTVLAGLRVGLPGRLVVVLGAGGDRDRAKRPLMGAAAVRHADRVVVTDDNPRGEDPAAIRAGVLTGARREAARHAAEVVEVADRRAAIHAAVRGTGRGDAVVVLGKGHEQGQEVAGRVHPFDDRRVLREALASRPVAREGECRG